MNMMTGFSFTLLTEHENQRGSEREQGRGSERKRVHNNSFFFFHTHVYVCIVNTKMKKYNEVLPLLLSDWGILRSQHFITGVVYFH